MSLLGKWISTDIGFPLDGVKIPDLKDQSGNGKHWEAPIGINQMTLVQNVHNGFPVIRGGATQVMEQLNTSALSVGTNNVTIMSVIIAKSLTSDRIILQKKGPGGGNTIRYQHFLSNDKGRCTFADGANQFTRVGSTYSNFTSHLIFISKWEAVTP